MGNIIIFPESDPPRPFQPTAAVHKYLTENACNAVASTRIPRTLKKALMQEAWESRARFSAHLARILATHLERRCVRCLNERGIEGKEGKEEAA